jgi:hypothetical protein
VALFGAPLATEHAQAAAITLVADSTPPKVTHHELEAAPGAMAHAHIDLGHFDIGTTGNGALSSQDD